MIPGARAARRKPVRSGDLFADLKAAGAKHVFGL